MNGEYTATIDRIVDGRTAVLLVEEDGEVVEQFDVPVEKLPSAARDGGVVTVTVEDGEVVDAEFRPEETEERREAIRDRLDRLSERLSDREESN